MEGRFMLEDFMGCEFDVLGKAVGEEVGETGDGVWEGVLVVFGEEVVVDVFFSVGENSVDVVFPEFIWFGRDLGEDSHSRETACGAARVGGFDCGVKVFDEISWKLHVEVHVERDVRMGFCIGEELVEVVKLDLGEAKVGGSEEGRVHAG